MIHNIVFTGAIGVGKSTLADKTYNTILSQIANNKLQHKCLFVKEYIDGDSVGPVMLQKCLTGEIDDFTFQSYIMHYYDKAYEAINNDIKSNPNTTYYIIHERLVDDSVYIFSNNAMRSGKLTNIQIALLYDQMESIHSRYPFIPRYFGNPRSVLDAFTVNLVDNSHQINMSYIMKFIPESCNSNSTLILMLNASPEICLERVLSRGRECERVYTIQSLEKGLNDYMTIYNRMYANPSEIIDITKIAEFVS